MKYSKFLPANYRGEAIALIAGKGRYPALIVEQIKSHGIPLKLIAIKDETDASLISAIPEGDQCLISLGQLSQLLKSLKRLNCNYVLMAGQVRPTRLFKDLFPDLKMLSILRKIKQLNAESVLGALITEIESIGCSVLDARSFMDEHLASEGKMVGIAQKVPTETIDYGIKIAKEIARMNIGQGIVIKGQSVLAVEALEGTNKMLDRTGSFNLDELIFVKTIKQSQDYRFDVPVFGEDTLEKLRENKIQSAVLESNSVILLDKEKLLEKAKAYKIQLYGYTAPESQSA
ncbi:MAG: hypothetical protein CML08_04170 [Puniceicoccaceae bacterium]|nr:hypothetical protein [Puniceicoccaceae bacterium]